MTTYHRALEAAFRSAYRILERIEERPWEAVELSRLRHLHGVRRDAADGGVVEPITGTTPCDVLCSPHPMRNRPTGHLVGHFDLRQYFNGVQPLEGWGGFRIRRDESLVFESGPLSLVKNGERGGATDRDRARAELQRLADDGDEYAAETLANLKP